MEIVSMTTRSLRDILQKARQQDLGFRILVARDIMGPGGSVFIAARTELTERHLTWLEQRNPSPRGPTYVDVSFSQESPTATLTTDLDLAAEAPDTAADRRRRASTLSREVGARAEEVVRQAREVYRIVGETSISGSALRNRKVRENLSDLDQRLQQFHQAARAALDDYLAGNTLIMDLIAQYDPGPRAVIHGLNVAVFATELASHIVIKAGDETDAGAAEAEEQPPQNAPISSALVEVFVGGFLHDCGLWDESHAPPEGHEAAGARLIWNLPQLRELAPNLVKIVLFHSDALRMANKPALVQIATHPDDADKLRFEGEFFASVQEAHKALRTQPDHVRATLLDEADRRRVLPVALAEYCITQTEGFEARTRGEAIGRLTRYSSDELYMQYVVALCNAQVEVVAPRRAYVELDGHLALPHPGAQGQPLELNGFAGGSILHGNDPSSPHLIVLSASGPDGRQQNLKYVDPHDPALWGRSADTSRRFYIAAGRHTDTISIKVTGFMSEAAYDNILGEYERALRGRMQM